MNRPPNLKINSSPLTTPYYTNNNGKNLNTSSFGKNKENAEKTKNDPLVKYPLRLCAYSNEIGAAVSPIPGIGHTIFMLSWIPALMYFGADIYDKYAKGNQNDYSNPSRKNAIKQATFQALASVILPTAAVVAGQRIASSITRFTDKNKMDIRAKEDILNELKRDLNQDKFRAHRDEISKLLKDNQNISSADIKKAPQVALWKKQTTDSIYRDICVESENLNRHRRSSNLLRRFVEFFMGPNRDCEYISKIPQNKFEKTVKPYLAKKVSDLYDSRIDMQKALNPDGTINEYGKNLDSKTLNKVKKLLKKNAANRNIVDKCSFVVKECAVDSINKVAMKLSGIKILGGFVLLGLLAQPIDHFVENKIIAKFMNPKP